VWRRVCRPCLSFERAAMLFWLLPVQQKEWWQVVAPGRAFIAPEPSFSAVDISLPPLSIGRWWKGSGGVGVWACGRVEAVWGKACGNGGSEPREMVGWGTGSGGSGIGL